MFHSGDDDCFLKRKKKIPKSNIYGEMEILPERYHVERLFISVDDKIKVIDENIRRGFSWDAVNKVFSSFPTKGGCPMMEKFKKI